MNTKLMYSTLCMCSSPNLFNHFAEGPFFTIVFHLPWIRNDTIGDTALDSLLKFAWHWIVVWLCSRWPPIVRVDTLWPLGSGMTIVPISIGNMSTFNKLPFTSHTIRSVSEWLHLYLCITSTVTIVKFGEGTSIKPEVIEQTHTAIDD
jgi:hypothetical protein